MFNFPTFNPTIQPDNLFPGFGKVLKELETLDHTVQDINQAFMNSILDPDENSLQKHNKEIIAGYLNLKVADGWYEGGPISIGILFTQFVTKKYWDQIKNCSVVNKIMWEKVINGLQNSDNYPKTSRACCDFSVTGWKDHGIARIIGNLSSKYDPSMPFFEILINSARPDANTQYSCPFFISIHANENELEERRRLLASLGMVSAELAHFSFYATYLKKPEAFLKETKIRLGPNSSRILEALIYLQSVQLNTQKSGSCWIKQPMRSLLVTLFIEIVTYEKIAVADAWFEAKKEYKNIQKIIVIPYIEKLLQNEPDVTSGMRSSALSHLEIQKKH
jgi:hypothetical protein